MTVIAAMDGPARMPAIGAAAAGCVQPQWDDEVILVMLYEPRDMARGDGEGDIHVLHDGEGRPAHQRPGSIHRHPRKTSKNHRNGAIPIPTLTLADRERVGREAGPTGAVLDAQAARSGGVGAEGVRGYDPAKRVVGRKRHALTDMDGRLLMAAISPADLHDSHGGVALLRVSRQLWPFLAHCFADRAY
jgi:hypothetical protein